MELRQLKYFVTIAETLHFGKAATRLYVSQPALSQQIQLLEDEIGVALFDQHQRKHLRKVVLTPAGEVFLKEASKILKLSQQAIETARKIGKQQPIIRLGVYKMLLKERIVETLTLLKTQFPDSDIKLVELPTFVSVQEALAEGDIELGLTLAPLKFIELYALNTLNGHLNIIVSNKHPLAKQESVYLSELKTEKWVEITQTLHPVFDEIEKQCQAVGFNRQIVQEVSSLDLLCSLVALGIGIAFVPSLYHVEHQGIVVKPILNDDQSPFHQIEIRHLLACQSVSIYEELQANL